MSQRIDTGIASFEAGEDLILNRLVKLSAARTVVYADSAEEAIGSTLAATASGDQVPVKLIGSGPGTLPCIASGVLSANALVVADDDGKVRAAAAGETPLGRILNASTADGDPVEVLPRAGLMTFISSEQTGTGSAQNVAHGLPGTPLSVLVAITEDPAGTGFDVAEGTHTSTNVVVTVTSGVKFKVLAWL